MTGETPSLFGQAPEKNWPVLKRTALVLIEGALPMGHPWRIRASNDLEALTPNVAPFEDTVTAAMLDDVLTSFDRKTHSISNSPFAAFLAARTKDTAHRRAGNMLSAWVLAAALHRYRLTPTQNAIAQGLNAARSLKLKAPASLGHLQEALTDPRTLRDALGKTRKEHPDKTVSGYFESLWSLMRAALKGGDAIHRAREAAGGKPPDTPLPLMEEREPNGITRITGGFVPEPPEFAGPMDIQRADRVPGRETVRGKDDAEDFSPARISKARTQHAARASARRSLSLCAEEDPLTHHEVAVLMAWLSANSNDPAYAQLLADLVFGPAHTRTGAAWGKAQGHFGLRLSVDLPEFEPLVETGDSQATDEHLFLPSPPGVFAPPKGNATDAAAALQSLRSKLARPLTRGRITRYKADWLRRAGADAAVTGFLTGKSPGNRAQLHYTCLDRATLLGWHLFYLEQGLRLTGLDWTMPEGVYGSRLRIPPDLLADIFRGARKAVRDARPPGPGSLAQIQSAHNIYTIYTLALLFLATGHRPVSHPFEFRTDTDLETGLVWISDKTGRGSRGTRLLPLAPRAVSQLHAWTEHLNRLERRLSLTHPRLIAPIRAALSTDPKAQGPFFLFFDDKGALVPLKPALQTNAFAPVLPTALNWTRHVLRSALVGKCTSAAIDAFLGHGHIGEDPFISGSSLRLGDLWPVADAIETILAALGASALESPL